MPRKRTTKPAPGVPPNRLEYFRVLDGLSQAALAKKAELTIQTISNIERRQNPPSLDSKNKLSKAMGIDIQKLFPYPYLGPLGSEEMDANFPKVAYRLASGM